MKGEEIFWPDYLFLYEYHIHTMFFPLVLEENIQAFFDTIREFNANIEL